MNLKSSIFTLLVGICYFMSAPSFAQTDTTQVNKEKQAAVDENKKNVDRLKAEVQKNEDLKNEAQKTEAQKSQSRLKDAENLQQGNKAVAKEANRVNKDAEKAVKESKRAAKAERRAQKARMDADKQAEKATKATQKSKDN